MSGFADEKKFPGNSWNSENCYSESENITREINGKNPAALSVRSNLSKSPVEEYWE